MKNPFERKSGATGKNRKYPRLWYRDSPHGTFDAELHTAECPYCLNGTYFKYRPQAGNTFVWMGPFPVVVFVLRFCRRRKLSWPIPCTCLYAEEKLSEHDKEMLKKIGKNGIAND
jgi:hypothetical protein